MESTYWVCLLLIIACAFRLGWDGHVRGTGGAVHPICGTVGKVSGVYGIALFGAVVALG